MGDDQSDSGPHDLVTVCSNKAKWLVGLEIRYIYKLGKTVRIGHEIHFRAHTSSIIRVRRMEVYDLGVHHYEEGVLASFSIIPLFIAFEMF